MQTSNSLKEGFHLYLGISNFNELIDLNPNKNKFMTKLIFDAFDLLLNEMEKGCTRYPKTYIEKIAGSRIHCIIENNGSQQDLSLIFYDIVRTFFKCVDLINNKINKFNKIDDFIINVGCDYGYYSDYEILFVHPSEDNSIGSPCNKAAKIQSYCDANEIIVSRSAFSKLNVGSRKLPFSVVGKERIVLKGTDSEDVYYSLSKPKWESIDSANKVADNGEMNEFTRLVESLNRNYSNENYINLPNKFTSHNDSTMVFCDIRGFTKMFKSDGSNLVRMISITSDALKRMNYVGSSKGLNHIQFQGDREVFCNDNSVSKSIIASLLIIDEFKKHACELNEQFSNSYKDVAVGIGLSTGSFYMNEIGIRGSRSPFIVGSTYIYADKAEDKYASRPYSISLHKTTYDRAINDGNKAFARTIAKLFSRIPNTDYYILNENASYQTYMYEYNKATMDENHHGQSSDGGKPWSF